MDKRTRRVIRQEVSRQLEAFGILASLPSALPGPVASSLGVAIKLATPPYRQGIKSFRQRMKQSAGTIDGMLSQVRTQRNKCSEWKRAVSLLPGVNEDGETHTIAVEHELLELAEIEDVLLRMQQALRDYNND